MISFHYADLGGNVLSSEVSAIYLSMKNSKLECADEYSQNHISEDVHMEDDECEEFDEFDPYFFIKNLPELSSIVPTFRPMLLPKRTRSCPPTTLVLDLDGKLTWDNFYPHIAILLSWWTWNCSQFPKSFSLLFQCK